MHSSLGLPYPAGHWFYSLHDLLDNPVFMVSFFAFWGATVYLLLGIIYRKFNISETVEMVVIALLMILMTLSFYLCAILKASF
ncbi:hypothetical protein LHS65_004597 [Escherichia coli]|uniref:hypothetical protein n=1 Tax=Enterobacteriaceae TaxID=543 RepID=UPI000664119B|nr:MULTISPECIES: hypothetical protein [Enterobacteriaceae]EAA4756287.1 hypothetical protein [Shigella sonnei]EAA5277025.1 hypothetical protein [Salmonella enterica subsp. enterica serovar Chester]EAY3359562.1 hypothetical protein [Salmonella enterica subsp. enterica serovar Typhimurium]EBS4148806.1 hypothetical protein [Salmonella enterica subsp. enterica serovar Enteritidis]EBV7866849.1 hypothetical protein [Salmonella enterica subsp. enterica serovar Bovismorbificans]EBW9728867.1 hypothetic